jgi:hypothetical protein
LAESRNIGLDSVIARQREDYEKYNFKFAYRILCYAGSSSIIRTSTKPSKYLADLKGVRVGSPDVPSKARQVYFKMD